MLPLSAASSPKGSGDSQTLTNSLQQMTSLTVKDASNAFVLNVDYRFSATANDGKLTSMKNNISGEEVMYGYDSLSRLTSASTVGPQWGLAWTFDGFGNRLQQNITKGTAPPSSILVDPATNRVQSWSYDANGNATFIPGVGSMTYDVADRLKTAGGETYYYDAGNKRIWKNNEFTFWAGARVGRYTLSAAGFVKLSTDEYFAGRRLQVLDRLGSNREGGKDYFPYGEERSATANPGDKFGTYQRDSTGLDYADQRYYSSSAGRFLSKDPAADGSNHFSYTDGDPVNRSDPSGQYSDPCAAGCLMAPPEEGGGIIWASGPICYGFFICFSFGGRSFEPDPGPTWSVTVTERIKAISAAYALKIAASYALNRTLSENNPEFNFPRFVRRLSDCSQQGSTIGSGGMVTNAAVRNILYGVFDEDGNAMGVPSARNFQIRETINLIQKPFQEYEMVPDGVWGAGAEQNETFRQRIGTATFADVVSLGGMSPPTSGTAIITQQFHAIQLTPTQIIIGGVPRNITMVNAIQELVVADGTGASIGLDRHFGTLVHQMAFRSVSWNGSTGTGGVPCRH